MTLFSRHLSKRTYSRGVSANLRPLQLQSNAPSQSYPQNDSCARILREALLYLSEEPLASSSSGGGVVDVDVVVFGANRFFHKRLGKHLPIHLYMVLPLYQATLCQKDTWNGPLQTK